MNITTTKISKIQAKYILNLEEDHFHDVKAIDIKPSKLTKTISAFANTVGGEVYVGVDEVKTLFDLKREWRGFMNTESANGHLQIFEELFPLGDDFSYTFLQCDGHSGLMLQITILKTRQILRASDLIPYIRRGATSLPVNTDEKLRRLQLDKGLVSFENHTISIETNFIAESYTIYEFMTEIIPSTEPEPWLRKQLLIRNNLPTVAAILLFSDNPQAALPKQSGIKIYRYKSREADGTRETLAFDPISVEGNAYELIRVAVQKVTEIIEGITIISHEGEVRVAYPNETLHEIITNSVLHRDYSIASDIHIRIFDNRVEVESPGKLPGHITIKNILREQFARNGSMVRLINKFPNPPNKDVGEGLNTAFEAMKKLKLKEPLIEELENSVKVYIKHESLASPDDMVNEYLKSNSTINNSTARDLTGVSSESRMKKIFYTLQEKGQIEQTPGTRGRGITWRRKV